MAFVKKTLVVLFFFKEEFVKVNDSYQGIKHLHFFLLNFDPQIVDLASKIFICGHLLFVTYLLYTHTNTVGAFLTVTLLLDLYLSG